MAGARDAIAAAVAAQIEQAAAEHAAAIDREILAARQARAAEAKRREAVATEEGIAAMVAADGASAIPLQPWSSAAAGSVVSRNTAPSQDSNICAVM